MLWGIAFKVQNSELLNGKIEQPKLTNTEFHSWQYYKVVIKPYYIRCGY